MTRSFFIFVVDRYNRYDILITDSKQGRDLRGGKKMKNETIARIIKNQAETGRPLPRRVMDWVQEYAVDDTTNTYPIYFLDNYKIELNGNTAYIYMPRVTDPE